MKTYEDKKRARINTSMFILITISLFLLFLFSCSINVHASSTSDVAAAIVDSMHQSGGHSGHGGYINGMSESRTGYLCYLLTKNGETVPGSSAKAFKSPNANYIDDSLVLLKPRKGDYYKPTSWTAVAPWGCAPYSDPPGGKFSSNEPAIKSWLAAPSSIPGHPNAQSFIKQYWGEEVADVENKFATDDYILIIETVMNFQWGAKNNGSESEYMTQSEAVKWAGDLADSKIYYMLSGLTGLDEDTQAKVDKMKGIIDAIRQGNANEGTYIAYQREIGGLKNALIAEIYGGAEIPREYSAGSTAYFSLFGRPLIATVPQALIYKNTELSTEDAQRGTNSYKSYMNYNIPFAEMVTADGCGVQAGFKYGGTLRVLTDQEVENLGVAMLAVSASSLGMVGTHTWDSVNQPAGSGIEAEAPLPPTTSLPSECQYTIIKSYRLRTSSALDDNLGVELEDKGTYIREETISNIEIEDEPLNETDKNYKVIGWKISNTPKPINLDAINWEGEVPQPIRDSGTTTSNVALDKDHKFLYVLLEANEATTSTLNTNYIISEATITRCVRLSHPDSQLTLPLISSYSHPWKL